MLIKITELKKADLVCDDIRVLNLLVRLDYLIVSSEGTYFLTPKGQESELGTELLGKDDPSNSED